MKWNAQGRRNHNKCAQRAGTILRNRYKQEWKQAVIEARRNNYANPERRADTVIRVKYKIEWKREFEIHAKLIGYSTMTMRQLRSIQKESEQLSERLKKLSVLVKP